MKIFMLSRSLPGEGLTDDEIYRGAPGDCPVRVLPDSAVTPKGMPVFVPDFARAGGWCFRALAAYRVGRLGKCIGRRFAGRYIDGVTVGALLTPEGGTDAETALEYCFDSALTLGRFQAPCQDSEPMAYCFGQYEGVFSGDGMGIADAVALVSRYCTLRTGDVIIPGFLPGQGVAEIGTRYEFELCGERVGVLRVK